MPTASKLTVTHWAGCPIPGVGMFLEYDVLAVVVSSAPFTNTR